MSEERLDRVRELFLAALELSETERRNFLESVCAGDVDLVREVEELLECSRSSPSFLTVPAGLEHREWFETEDEESGSRSTGKEEGAFAAESEDADEIPMPRSIGGYEIIRALGEGGMGIVYLAEQPPPLRRKVALKVIKLGMDTREVLARFHAERRALALMNHPSIAQVYDSGVTEGGQPFFAMERIDGLPIHEHCDRSRLDVTRRLELFLEVIAAVRHAHQKGIIHRDLKPTNILVADVDGRARPKVIDFGIARATEGISAEWTYRSHDGRIIGTPEYMSPEQASSNAALVDTRSDVYSLGVILYEILVGALPFDHRELRSSGLGALLRTIRDVEPPRPTTRLRSLPSEKIEEIAAARSSSIATLRRQLRGDLEHVVARALERDPDRRYPSVAELGADLERYLRGEAVLATRPSLGYRVAKFARRHRAAVTLVAAIAATLIASLVLAIRAYLEAEDARSELESTLALRDHDLRERWQALLRAERARQRSEALRWLAEARSIAPTRPEVALHLALRVAKIESGSHVNDSLLEVLSHFVPFEESRNEGGTVGLLYSPGGRFLAASSHTTATTVLLDATTLEEVRSFPGYSHRIALSPDGTLIATNDGRDAVSIFRVDTGERIAKTSRTSLIYDLTFDSTGARVIGALVGGDVRIWEARTGRMIRRIRAHEDRVYRAALSHDDRFLLTASRDGTARLYDLASSGEPRTLALGAQVDDVAFSPQGDRLAAVTASGRVIVEETETGRTIIDRVLGAGALRSVSFRPDGGAIVTGSQAGIVFIIEIDSGREISLRGHRDQVEHAEHSPDGTRVVTASFDKTAKLWDATTGEMLVELVGHEDRVQRAVFARDGRRVATVSFDGTVRTWALETVLAQRSYRHEDYAYSVGFSPDGRFVVSTSRDGTVRMARVDPFELARTMTHDARVYRARFDPNGELLVASRSDGSCHVSHMGSGERIATLAGHQGVVLGLAVDPRGRWVATASEDRTVRVWSLADGTELWRGEEEARVDVVAFDPDGTLVASGSRGGVTRLRDAASGVEIRSWADHERQVSALAFTPDGRYLITASTDHRVRVRDLRRDGEIRALDRHERGVLDLVVAPRGTFLVTASADESAIVWDLASAKPTLELRSHHSAVCAVAISPDEAWIATASHDGTAKLWDARTGALAASYPAGESRLVDVEISPDSRWVATCAENGEVRLWPIDIVGFASSVSRGELSPEELADFEIPAE